MPSLHRFLSAASPLNPVPFNGGSADTPPVAGFGLPPASDFPATARWYLDEVQPHESALRGWLRRKFGAPSDVDDIVQESYLRLLRAREGGKITCVRAYLFGIAHHVAVELFRRRRVLREITGADLHEPRLVDEGADVVERVSAQEELVLATEALKALPERCRTIVILRSFHGYSYREIAAQLGVAEETVRVQMARGIKKCAQFLRERGMNERRSL